MKTALVRLAAVTVAVALAACGSDEAGSARLKNLEEGMTVSQAVEAMGPGPLTATYSDTMRVVGGYRRQTYLLDGSVYQVLYARDLPGDVKEPLLQANETPIVFRNDSLLGSGWRYYVDEGMSKFRLPSPLRARDTMTTPADTAARGMPAAPETVPVDSVPQPAPQDNSGKKSS